MVAIAAACAIRKAIVMVATAAACAIRRALVRATRRALVRWLLLRQLRLLLSLLRLSPNSNVGQRKLLLSLVAPQTERGWQS